VVLIRSLSQAAQELGVCRKTVGDLVRERKLPTVPHPNNGLAKGLDPHGFAKLRSIVKGTPAPQDK
jgi:hypothetical protein